MQDKYKFRVWCKDANEWETDEIHITNRDDYVIYFKNFIRRTNNDPVSHEINLCSGLKDKNGKLIYEGDIIKFKYGKGCRIGEVVYDKSIWMVTNSQIVQNAYVSSALINTYNACEIVGNKYETPELLNEVNND